MTDLRTLLEDFSKPATGTAVNSAPVLDEAEIEGQKLEAFENGYKAGWDDAVKAQSDDSARITSTFGQHLQDLSFTYHEAYGQMINAMTPLLDEMINALLPGMARATLGAHITEQLTGMAKSVGALKVVIAVSPNNLDAIAPLIDADFGFPIELVADETLAEEQADIRFGETEKQIDLGDVLTSVSEAVQGFTHDNQRKVANG